MATSRYYTDPREFDAVVDAHWMDCEMRKQPLTKTGFALALGFTSTQAMNKYRQYEAFAESVDRVDTIVKDWNFRRVHSNNPTGAIFTLKTMGESDKPESDKPLELNVKLMKADEKL